MDSDSGGYRDSSSLRVSDADRDCAAAELSEHFQAGRLTQDEFDERVGQALSARTRADLDELLADLPSHRPAGSLPADSLPATADASQPAYRGLPRWAGPWATLTAAVLMVAPQRHG